MRLAVLAEERFSCHSCTDCCRQQFVELFSGEPERIEQLTWPAGDALAGVKGLVQHGGKTYLNHRADGSCVFLNDANGLCRIHEKFGAQAKPMSCRLFPFQITPTFRREASISTRYDCPTVRKNQGQPHSDALPLLHEYADHQPMAHGDGFDDATRCHLDRGQMAAVVEFLSIMLNGFDRNEERAMLILYLSAVLAQSTIDQLDRSSLAGVFAPLKEQIKAVANEKVKKPGLIHRMAFRTLLALYLRRDEDVLNGRASRLARMIAMIRFVLGFGSFSGLGLLHPPGRLKDAGLFKSGPKTSPETFGLLWRLVRNKLESFTFLGPANGNRNFVSGLRSLALVYPLTVAAARHRAASRGSEKIDESDVDYAVAVIEHSFGRSAVLNKRFIHSIETLLLDRDNFNGLVQTI